MPPNKKMIKQIIRHAICIYRNDNFVDSDRENACDIAFMEKSAKIIHTWKVNAKYTPRLKLR